MDAGLHDRSSIRGRDLVDLSRYDPIWSCFRNRKQPLEPSACESSSSACSEVRTLLIDLNARYDRKKGKASKSFEPSECVERSDPFCAIVLDYGTCDKYPRNLGCDRLFDKGELKWMEPLHLCSETRADCQVRYQMWTAQLRFSHCRKWSEYGDVALPEP